MAFLTGTKRLVGKCHRCGWRTIVGRTKHSDRVRWGRAYGQVCDECREGLDG